MNIIFEFDGSIGNLVEALAAVEAAANAMPTMKAYWKFKNDSLWPVVKSAWFTKGLVKDGDDLTRFDAVCKLRTSKKRTQIREMDFRAELKELIDSQIALLVEKTKLSEDHFKKPKDYPTLSSKIPSWGRMTGYLIALSEATKGTALEQVGAPIPLEGLDMPMLPHSKALREAANLYLRENRKEIKPGLPYIVVGNANLFKKYDLEISKPAGWQVIFADKLDPFTVCGLVSHDLCKAVYSAAGELSHVGWAAGKTFMLELMDDTTDSYWTICRSPFSACIDLSREATAPESVKYSLNEMYRNAFGIGVEY